MKRGKTGQRLGAMAVASFVLSGCMGGEAVTKLVSQNPLTQFAQSKSDTTVPQSAVQTDAQSDVIQDLLGRRSILSAGSSYDQVARGVLEANSRTAEAELRGAKLRAEAADKNWLPTLGPSVSLNSLGAVVASLVVDQVIFDNGRKRAERDFAQADVEVAAVNLTKDSNDRVFTALDLYIQSLEAREKAALSHTAKGKMAKFEWVMEQRVQGGVSDRSDLEVLRQKVAVLDNNLANDQELANIALAELNAMSTVPLGGVKGLSPLNAPANVTPLEVVKAEAEMQRDVAEATMARAGFLPGIFAGGTVLNDGTALGVNVAAENGIGFGTGASLKAIEAEQDAANRRLAQTREDVHREFSALEQKLASARRQHEQSAGLLAKANANLALFEEQVQSGQRALTEAVGVYETKIRTEREALTHKYRVALLELEMAALMGVLVDGGDV